ncbi:hypothetical protein M6B38_397300 [Iris pallida]|uniref:Uncharacterized protein n=1 Tax=Iris pallida TaxID=29817 RepID=A0AAX6FWQ4_IRIPA|nr:hypothetical protein M6B38_397300 [Iris pallida]
MHPTGAVTPLPPKLGHHPGPASIPQLSSSLTLACTRYPSEQNRATTFYATN